MIAGTVQAAGSGYQAQASTSNKGQLSTEGLVGAMVIVIVGVALFPAVNDQVANLTNLSTTEQAIADLIPLIYLVGVFVGAAAFFGLV